MLSRKATIDLVVDLPNAPLADLLNAWLWPWAVANLDSAYCNKRSRPLLMQALASSCITDTILAGDEEQLRWMIARKIKCTSVFLSVDWLPEKEVLKSFLSCVGPAVTTIVVNNPEDEKVHMNELSTAIAQLCPKLRKFCCKQMYLSRSITQVLTQCQQLKDVNLSGCLDVPESLLAACFAAPHLESLDVSECQFPMGCRNVQLLQSQSLRTLHATATNIVGDALLRMCGSGPQLTTLSLGPSSERPNILKVGEIAQLCPLLQRCTIIGCNAAYINVATTTAVAKTWTNIEELTLEPTHYFYSEDLPREEALLVFIKQCPLLRILYTKKSAVLTKRDKHQAVLSPAQEKLNLSRLTVLQIGSISAEALQTVVSHCPCLHTLHLVYEASNPLLRVPGTLMAEDALHLLHNSSVKALMLEGTENLCGIKLARISGLQEVYFRSVRGDFTSQDIFDLVRRCPELHTLVLADLFTDDGLDINIRLLIEACPKLNRLAFSTTEGSGRECASVAALCEVLQHFYPNLQELALFI